MPSAEAENLNWLINDLVERVPGLAHAIVVSADGLLIIKSDGIPQDRAEQLSAVASGLVSLTRGAARCFDADDVKQTVVEMNPGFLLLMSISDGSILTTLAGRGCDIGLVGYEMTLLVKRVGELLTPDLRAELQRRVTVPVK
jgi:predicted regulator of Ras-like GTPase activity (Roadblock/LC7/MglB family)